MVLPAIAGVSGMFAGIAVLYSKIRPRLRVKVNCWFCNKDVNIEYRYSDGWMCPSCQQYNGFTEDGDYNQDIPAQYCESLNHTLRPKCTRTNTQPGLALGNGFCQTCNCNQALKVRALADYTPIHPENYDNEIDEYKKRLERTYSLCRQCEATLHQTLGKQDSWLKPKLISWRLQLSAENKTQIFANTANVVPRIPFYLRLVRVFGLLISLGVLLSNVHHLQQHSGVQLVSLDFGLKGEIYLTQIHKFLSPLIITGLTLVLISIFGAGRETLLVSDAITSFVWVGLLTLCSSKKLLSSEDFNSLQVLISVAAVLFTLWTLLVPRTLRSTRLIKPPLNKSMSDKSSTRLDDTQCTYDASLSEDLKNLTPPLTPRSGDLTSTPVSSPPRSVVEGNIDSVLESLKISTPYKRGLSQPNAPFSPKALFSDKPGYNPKINDTYCLQRSIVSPSRLSAKNITQSSWVAGGYWGSPMSPREFSPCTAPKPSSINLSQQHIFPLSRSSSQSSGYISHNSGLPPYANHGPYSLPNSHQGSVCGDYERGSVFSEPAYKSWVPPVSLNPSDSISQCSYGRGRARSEAQSLYSCASVFSGSSMQKTPPSPSGSASCLFQEALGNLSDNSNFSLSSRDISKSREMLSQAVDPQNRTVKPNPSLNYRSPWFAFFLGMSFAANGFFIALLLSRSDLDFLILK